MWLLFGQADEVAAALAAEQSLVKKLQQEASASSAASQRLLELEASEKEAARKAAELAGKALEAEKQLVEAMREEAAASSELLEAERAARFAAQVGVHCSSDGGGAPRLSDCGRTPGRYPCFCDMCAPRCCIFAWLMHPCT